jgi:hypothetical protein
MVKEGEYSAKLHTHVCKWEIETCRNYSRNGEEGIKDDDGGGEFNYNTCDIL